MVRFFNKYFLFLFFISCHNLYAQVVTITPSFATQNDQVTILFDASKGNKALLGQTVVYAHTGVITNLSSSATAWKYVQGNWGTDDAKVKMTKVGANLFSLTYTINTFYNVPNSETVLKLAFVFRNQAGSLVGREADGTDIFVAIGSGSFQARFDIEKAQLLSISDTLKIKAITSKKASLRLLQNGNAIQTITNDSILQLSIPAASLSYGKFKYIFEATYNGNTKRDTMYALVRSVPPTVVAPAGTKDGINYISDTSIVLQIFAPYKNFIYVWGDHSNWELDPKFMMNRTPDGARYWIQLNGLIPNKEYRFQYLIDQAQIKIADIYADKLLDANNDAYIPAITYPNLIPYPKNNTTEYVSVFQTAQPKFNWQHSATFKKPAKEKLFIYELLLRDFIARHDFETLKDTLNYLQKLGVNAIELMPVNEFEGNESWGYNPAFYFAVDKYYGSKNAFKSFIDECHRRGIAVIIDMVLNHSFGQSPMVRMYADGSGRPTANNPWFNVNDKHPYGVGYDFNHESTATQKFADSVLRYWIEDYKVDGYRFDLSKGFTQKDTYGNVGAWGQYDATRIAIWNRIYNKVRSYDSTAYLILEHFADNSEEKELAQKGFMLWGNLNHNFSEATMGYVNTSDLSWGNYKYRTWTVPHLVTYAESHDEERLMFKNLTYGNTGVNYSAKNLNTALKRNEMAMCFLIPLQGPKMIWQFGELGYDISIDFNGRVGNKPVRWDYFADAARKRLYEVTALLGYLKNNEPAFSSPNYVYNTTNSMKVYKVTHSTLNAVVVGNFDVKTDSTSPIFPHLGKWYALFSDDSITVTDLNQKVVLGAGKYVFWLDKKINKPFQLTGIASNPSEKEDEIFIYPNPAHQEIFINFKNREAELVQVKILNALGEMVKQAQFDAPTENIALNLINLTPGIYQIQIIKGLKITTKKIIIN